MHVAHVFTDDREHESDIMGKDTWGTFGHASEAEFDEDIGIFHPSVTPSPTVITLCGNVAVKKPPKITCHPLPDAFNPCEYKPYVTHCFSEKLSFPFLSS